MPLTDHDVLDALSECGLARTVEVVRALGLPEFDGPTTLVRRHLKSLVRAGLVELVLKQGDHTRRGGRLLGHRWRITDDGALLARPYRGPDD
jgi:DNA-binding transcriptional ArsR family regulator